MRLVNPNVPDWTVEVTGKEEIQAHLNAGWQEVPKRSTAKKAVSAKAVKAADETSSVITTEGDN
ncbi:hypothetical protein QFZ58_002047 [Streptomyces sp. B1I3]|nr:hypothetical protein [Streptomyces sp. B1I3]